MKSITHYFPIFFLPTILISAGPESQEAHTHGRATLTLALENGILEIKFESPAVNLVGFEHRAKSPEHRKTVTQTETILNEPYLLFSFVDTHCQPDTTTVDVSGIIDEEHDGHDGHEDNSHSKAHDESAHSEISAHYRFRCKDPQTLNSVSVALLSQFTGIEKIDVVWITENKQGAVSLTSNKNTILLR